MNKRLALLFLVMFFSIACSAQHPASNDDDIIRMGPDERADLVLFFKKGTDWKEILEFNRSVIGIPNESGSGFQSLPGMMSAIKIQIYGFEGEAINFKPNATDEEKTFLKKRVEASPLVYKVYENVIPEAINDLNESGASRSNAQSILVKRILSECSYRSECEIKISDAMPFSWDRLYVFGIGTLDVDINEMIKTEVSFAEESSYKYVFMKRGEVILTEEHHVPDPDMVPDGLIRFATTDPDRKYALVQPTSNLRVTIDRRNSGTSYILTCTDCGE